jgi:hypothetical protein
MNLPVQKADIRVFYDKPDLLPREKLQVLQARRDILANAATAKRLNVTPDQIKQLQAVPAGIGGGLKIEPADRQKLKQLWEAYNAAPAADKKSAEAALLAELKSAGQGALDPTRAQYDERIQKIQSILTSDQLKKIAG